MHRLVATGALLLMLQCSLPTCSQLQQVRPAGLHPATSVGHEGMTAILQTRPLGPAHSQRVLCCTYVTDAQTASIRCTVYYTHKLPCLLPPQYTYLQALHDVTDISTDNKEIHYVQRPHCCATVNEQKLTSQNAGCNNTI